MVSEYSKVAVFQVSEASAFKKVLPKSTGIQSVVVKSLLKKQEVVHFQAKVVAISQEFMPKACAEKSEEAAKGILKREEPLARAKKRVRFESEEV